MKRLAIALIVLVTLSGCEVIGSQLLIPLIAENDPWCRDKQFLCLFVENMEKADGRTRNRVEATARIQ